MNYESPTAIIARVGAFLGVPLPVEQQLLIEHLQGLESTRYELAQTTAKWHRTLAEQRSRLLYPRDKDLKLTELDRTTMLDAHTAPVKEDYEFLCKLEELVKDRLELGKTLLQLN